MVELADRAERARALDVTRSFIVQAPAGSGKTELLTQRFLALLATVEQPEELLAITFTRKAAAEMRARIVDALTLAQGPEPEGSPARERWALARAALARSEAQGWDLARNPGRLQLMTMDGLDRRLAARLPVLAGGRGSAAMAERPELLYREAARRLLAGDVDGPEDGAHIATLLRHLDHRVPRAIQLIADLLGRRDQWLRHLVGGDDGGLEQGLADYAAWAIGRFATLLEDADADLLARAAAWAADQGGKEDYAACIGLAAAPPPAAEALDPWRAMASLLLTKTGLRASLTARVGLGKDFPELAEANALLERLKLTTRAEAELRRLAELPSLVYSESQRELLASLPRVLVLAAAHLALLFDERGEVDFVGVSQAAREALEQDGAPTELLLALDHRYRHLMVDEFQDTSIRQVRMLALLTEGWTPGDGRTLFCVGDPMQSIYRFREADVGLFLQVRREGLGAVALEPLQLSANFRSDGGLVDWVNHRFAELFTADEDPLLGAVGFAAASAVHAAAEDQPLSWVAELHDGAAGLAHRVADAIAARRAAAPERRIALLVQKRSQLKEVLPALRSRGLGYRGVDLLRLRNRPVVQDLLSLYHAFTHPADRLHWFALLRGPLVGLELVALEQALGRAPGSLPSRLADPSPRKVLDAAQRARADRLLAVYEQVQALRVQAPVARWLEAAWRALGGPETLTRGSELEEVQVLLALLASLDEGGEVRDPEELRLALDALYAPPDPGAGDALQVMTIHAAKGLEFDEVFLMLPSRGGQRGRPPLLHHLELVHSGRVLLGPIGAFGAERDPVHSAISALERERDLHEAARLLYVATTRAKHRLTLCGATSINDRGDQARPVRAQSGSLLGLLWDEAAPVMEAMLAASPRSALRETAGPELELRRLVADHRPEPPPPPWVAPPPATPRADEGPEFSWAASAARHVGTVTHRYLQRIAEEGLGRWDAARVADQRAAVQAQLAALGVPASARAAASERVLDALSRTLAHEQGRWLLEEHAEAHCELALSAWDGERVQDSVLDRSFVDEEGARWIVDYKTSEHAGGDLDGFLASEVERYRPQLQRYAELLAHTEQRPQRLALYYPLLERLVMVAPDRGEG